MGLSNARRALVVDSNPWNRRQVCDVLAKKGYEVSACESLSEGRKYFRSHPIVVAGSQGEEDDLNEFVAFVRDLEGKIGTYIIRLAGDLTEASEIGTDLAVDDLIAPPLEREVLEAKFQKADDWLEGRGRAVVEDSATEVEIIASERASAGRKSKTKASTKNMKVESGTDQDEVAADGAISAVELQPEGSPQADVAGAAATAGIDTDGGDDFQDGDEGESGDGDGDGGDDNGDGEIASKTSPSSVSIRRGKPRQHDASESNSEPKGGPMPGTTKYQYNLLIENAPLAMAMFDREMRYLIANSRWRTNFDLEGTPVLGRGHFDIFSEVSDRWQLLCDRAGREGREVVGEEFVEWPDGTTDWVRWTMRPWDEKNGEAGGLVVSCGVITEEKGMSGGQPFESGLAESLMNSGVAPLVVLDFDGRVLRCNRIAERWGEWGEASGHDRFYWDAFVPETDREAVREAFLNCAEGMSDGGQFKYPPVSIEPVRSSDGEVRRVAWTNTPRLGEGGVVTGVVRVGVEIRHEDLPQVELLPQVEMEAVAVSELQDEWMDSFPLMCWRTNSRGKVKFFNRQWLDFRGRNALEECDNGWMDGLHEEDHDSLIHAFDTAAKTGARVNHVARVLGGDGQYRWLRFVSARDFSDLAGEGHGFIGYCEDLGRIIRLESELSAAKSRYDELLEDSTGAFRAKRSLEEKIAALEERLEGESRRLAEERDAAVAKLEAELGRLDQQRAEAVGQLGEERVRFVRERDDALASLAAQKDEALAKLVMEQDEALTEVVTNKDEELARLVAEKDDALAQLTAERDDALAKLAAEREDALAEKGAALAKVMAEKGAALAKLTAEKGAALAKLTAEKEDVLAEKDEALAKLTAEKDEALAKLTAEMGEALTKLTAQKDAALAGLTAEKDGALAELTAEKDGALKKLTAQKDEALAGLTAEKDAALERALAKKEKEMERVLEEKQEDLAQRESTLTAALKDREAELEGLRSQSQRAIDAVRGELQGQVAKLESERATLEENFSALRAKFDTAAVESAKLAADVESEKEQRKARDAELAKLRKEIDSQHREATAALKQRDQFMTIPGNAPFGMVLIARDGEIVYTNPATDEIAGVEFAQFETVEQWLEKQCPVDDDVDRNKLLALWRDGIWRQDGTKVVSMQTAKGLRELELRSKLLGDGQLLLSMFDVTDSRRAEDALRASEVKFRSIFYDSGVGMALVDKTGNIFDANPSQERMLGYSRAELRKMHIEDCLSLEEIDRKQALLKSMAEKRLRSGEMTIKLLPKDKRPAWAHMNVSLVRDPDGEVIFAAYFFHDITKEREAITKEQEATSSLAHTQAEKQALVEASPDLIVVVGPDGVVKSVVPPVSFPLHVDRTMEGQPVSNVIPPIAGDYAKLAAASANAGGVETKDFTVKQQDKEFHFECRIAKSGEQNTVVVIRDVTAAKMAQDVMRRQALTFANIKDAIIVADLKGRINDWNPAAQAMFGYSREEVIGKGLYVLYDRDDPKSFKKTITTAIGKQRKWEGRTRFYRKDGTQGECEVTYVPLLDESGRPLALVGVSRVAAPVADAAPASVSAPPQSDAAANREAHQRLTRSLKSISTVLAAQESSNLRHDETRAELATGRARVEAVALLHEVFDEGGDSVAVDFGQYVRRLIQYLLAEFGPEHAGIEVHLNVKGILLPLQVAEPLAIILFELVSNSLKHAFAKRTSGLVGVSMGLGADAGWIVVNDDGSGLPSGFSLEGLPQHGIGLKIAEQQAALIGGQITVVDALETEFQVGFRLNGAT